MKLSDIIKKPIMPFDGVPTPGSTNPVTSQGIKDALDDKYDANNPDGFVDAAGAASAAPVQSVGGNLAGGTPANRIIDSPTYEQLANDEGSAPSEGDLKMFNGTEWENFSGADGEIIKAGATGFEAIQHSEALRSKVPFEKSLLAGLFPVSNIFAFHESNGFPDSGTINSGQEIINPNLTGQNSRGFNYGLGSATIYFSGISRNSSISSYFIKDSNNYIETRHSGNLIAIIRCLAGVRAAVVTKNFTNADARRESNVQLISRYAINNGNVIVSFSVIGEPDMFIFSDLSSLFGSVFATAQDAAIISFSTVANSPIQSIAVIS